MTQAVAHLAPSRLTLAEALALPRVAIGGGPVTGKTTLAARIGDRAVIHTDDFDGWGESVPFDIIAACQGFDRFVIEGIQVGRALRKGLVVDVVVWLQWAQAERTPKQRSTAKGCRTILDDWLGKVGANAPPVIYPSFEELRA